MRITIFVTLFTTIAAWSPSSKCQAAADTYCNTDCLPKISSRPCKGPLVARKTTVDHATDWRCHSPSTLDANKTRYVKGSCYCSRDGPIRKILKQCGDPDPSPVPPAPPTPQPPIASVDVFVPGELGYVGMRIPSILLLWDPAAFPPPPNATILALCECGQPHLPDGVDFNSTYPSSGCDICSKVVAQYVHLLSFNHT